MRERFSLVLASSMTSEDIQIVYIRKLLGAIAGGGVTLQVAAAGLPLPLAALVIAADTGLPPLRYCKAYVYNHTQCFS